MDISHWWDVFVQVVCEPAVISGLIAVLTPVIVIYARNEVRCVRLAQILYFSRSFQSVASGEDGGEINPSFEFVKSKYTYDIPAKFSDPGQESALMEAARRIRIGRSGWNILISSIGYVLVCFVGFEILLAQIAGLCGGASGNGRLANLASSYLVSGGATGDNHALEQAAIQTLTIMGVAFLGAYLASIRQFVRSLMVFDLSSSTFIRQTVEILTSVAVVTVLYRAFPDPAHLPVQVLGAVSSLTTTTAEVKADSAHGVSWLWLGLALALGLVQESSIRLVLDKFRSYMPWFKRTDDRFMPVTQSIPLEVLDGINFPIRYRLQECGIEEVQNLATYNPIMLHIESPYGIYQTVDWVGQAQLCCVVGLERFLLLRQLNFRTIFDLERAIRSDQGPPEFDRVLASVLFSDTTEIGELEKLSGLKLTVDDASAADGKGTRRDVGLGDFLAWVRSQVGKNTTEGKTDERKVSDFVEHMTCLIGDDLHVRRLRRIWYDISESLGEQSSGLPDDIGRNRQERSATAAAEPATAANTDVASAETRIAAGGAVQDASGGNSGVTVDPDRPA